MLPISICVITKNEEKHMPKFLSAIKTSMAGYDYELVIVDTGSTDSTISIAKEYTDKIYHFDWIGDFAAARNFSIECASNDWILVLDCDEYITDVDVSCFEKMTKQDARAVGVITRINYYDMNGVPSIYNEGVERFFNRTKYHYEGIIHEQIRCLDGQVIPSRIEIPIVADHVGYNGTPEETADKVKRNLDLLLKMLANNPDDPYLYFQIGQSYNKVKDYENACLYYGKGLEYDVDPRTEYVQMMVIGYGYALLDTGRQEEALGLEGVYEEFKDLADFVCLMGIIYLRNGMLEQAVDEFLKATDISNARVEGSNSYIPLFNLGCINEVLGNTEDAIALYKKCGEFGPAVDRLQKI